MDRSDGQDSALDPYVQQLLDAVAPVLVPWLERCVVATAIRLIGHCPAELQAQARSSAEQAAPEVFEELRRLLATDVDQQRTNPLSVLRAAVRFPTRLLDDARVPPTRRDEFALRAFPDDLYGLSPSTWADVDPSLQEPGLIWGAWKAKTVLDRRRTS